MTQHIPLGFEVGTGKPVEIPVQHMVVAGQTQLAGKTTTLEALISRGRLKAIAFVTKRGEKAFGQDNRAVHNVRPYFRERADWQFVASVLEATMRERLKFERSWIISASKGARTLADVHRNVRKMMEDASGLSLSVFTNLDAYLEIVVPRISKVSFETKLDLRPGINVLDLSDRDNFPSEMQALVMRSCLEWVYEREEGTISIIPEAWEFLPQSRNSPVKLAAIELIRKGAGLKNFGWFDSQDIGGIDKEVLRQCSVWLLGVQREANEITRTLSNIPAGIAKPRAGDIATLERGQFFACWGRHVVKTYVWPVWLGSESARLVAQGKEQIPGPVVAARPAIKSKTESEDVVTEKEANELRAENAALKKQIERLENTVDELRKEPLPAKAGVAHAVPIAGTANGNEHERLFQSLLARLLKEPAIIELKRAKPELNVSVSRKVVNAEETSCQGMIAILLSEGFVNNVTTATAVHKELKRRWNYGGISARCYEQLDKLTEMGFVTKEEGGYQAVPGMKTNIVQA